MFAIKVLAEKDLTSSTYNIYVLLLDMSKAFDTVCRNKLLTDLHEVLEPDNMHMMAVLIRFLAGKGNLNRNIPVQPVCNKLGHRRGSSMLGFHALTGSGMSGRVARRTNGWCFKVFMSCDDDILNALKYLEHL